MVIRWVFGYYDPKELPEGAEAPDFPDTPLTWRPQEQNTYFRDVTLLGIDIDRLEEQDDMPIQFHIGISILHTQDLHDICQARFPLEKSQRNIIRSYHWAVQDSEPYKSNDIRFCFGEPECIPLSNLGECLRNRVESSSPLIIVTHGISRERSILRKLNINLNQIFMIDTAKAARYPFREFFDSKLKRLLRVFDIPYAGGLLHVAGNDAHFVLRAMLMIAVSDARRELEHVPAWVRVLELVAQAPLPLDGEQKAVTGKGDKKRSQKRRQRELEARLGGGK